ncbi:MAG: hypothetical protein WBX25_10210 [Rhodomicrobium sp.]
MRSRRAAKLFADEEGLNAIPSARRQLVQRPLHVWDSAVNGDHPEDRIPAKGVDEGVMLRLFH